MKSYNNVSLAGKLYDYKLRTITLESGVDAICGTISLQVDAEGTVVSAQFFATPVYSSGKKNISYGYLEEIMNGKFATAADGKDPDWLSLTGSIDVSYFVNSQNTNGELARAQKVRGAFINPNKDNKFENKWKADLYITQITDIEADAEKELDRYLKVSGFLVDSYRKMVTEAQVQVRSEKAIDYISGLEASFDAPYAVSTWGNFQKVGRKVLIKNAFGEDECNEYASTQWIVSGMGVEPYEFGDESVLTVDQYKEFIKGLEEHKAEQAAKEKDKTPEIAF